MVSVWANHAAALAIDGDMRTICASHMGSGNWLSVRVPVDTPIGYTAVHNRQDAWRDLLGSFEVWVGSSPGDTTSPTAVRCGESQYDASVEPAPYVLWCAGLRSGQYVTLKQTGPQRYLTIAEFDVYVKAMPPPPPRAPMPVSPPGAPPVAPPVSSCEDDPTYRGACSEEARHQLPGAMAISLTVSSCSHARCAQMCGSARSGKGLIAFPATTLSARLSASCVWFRRAQ
jgi:hypothetical protein